MYVMLRSTIYILMILYLFRESSVLGTNSGVPPSPFEHVQGNYTDWESMVMDIQSQYCGKVCNKRFQQKPDINFRCAPCFCDDDCFLFNDCCPDKMIFENIQTPPMSTIPGCIQTQFGKNVFFARATAGCPKSYHDKTIVDSCHEQESLHWRYVKPVTDLTSNITYRNKYCAKCNGAVNVRAWVTETKCSRTSDYGTSSNMEDIYFHVLNNDNCSLAFKPGFERAKTYRSCIPVEPQFYSQCNETGRWKYYEENIEKACLMYTNIILGTYKNVFCRLCNAPIFWDDLSSEPMGNIMFAKFSLDTLLDLRDDSDTPQSLTRQMNVSISNQHLGKCNVNEFLDPTDCSCRPKTCADREILFNGTCQSIFPRSNNSGYELQICFRGTYNASDAADGTILENFVGQIFTPWQSETEIVTSVSYIPINVHQCSEGLLHMEVEAVARIIYTTLVNTDERQLDLIRKAYMVGHIGKCYSSNSISFDSVKQRCSRIDLSPLHTNYMNDTEADLSHFEFRKLTKLMTCEQVFVNSTHVDYVLNNIIILLHNNITLTDTEYEKHGEYFAVCIEDYLNRTSQSSCMMDQLMGTVVSENIYTSLGITSMVSSCTSLLFLLISFIYYCVHKSLRTVVGVNVMGLIVTLFFAQLVYEFGLELRDYPELCKIAGVLIHYFWLSATFWMNACTLLLFVKLSFPIQSRGMETGTVFKWSFAYSTLSPLLIVSSTLAVNFATDGTCGYGDGNKCYIQSVNERRFAFALPLGVLVAANIGLFIFTFIKIRPTKMKTAINREIKINILACVRLSAITGALWIFAFIYEVTKGIVFRYIFTLLIGAQGVLIFFAFIANRRVCDECKRKKETVEQSHSGCHTKQGKYATQSTTDSPLSSRSLAKSSSGQDSDGDGHRRQETV